MNRLRTALLVAAGLALYWVMAVSVSPRMGATSDEVIHLTGGYSYWKFNDYRIHPENGTLPMRIAALPLLAMNLDFPPLDRAEWQRSNAMLVGDHFFFSQGNPRDVMLHRARMMVALVGAFLVWLTWRWARGLFGPKAGWIALGLAAFCPTLLAHGALATSEIGMAACVLSALSLVWLALHRVTWQRLAAAALVCGLAFLSKMSGVLIVPLIAGMVLVRWLRPAPLVLAIGPVRWLRRRAHVMMGTLLVTLVIAAGSVTVLWAGYGFRFSTFNEPVGGAGSFYFGWDVLLEKEPLPWPEGSSLGPLVRDRRPEHPTGMTRLIEWIRDRRLLPEAYLYGFAHTYKFSRYRPAFFLGEHRTTGWRTFFPVAFLLKTPLAAIALMIAGCGALAWTARHRPPGVPPPGRWAYRATPLILFLIVYWIMAIRMSLNIGHRHILPTYPVFYVLASGSALWLAGRARRGIAAALAGALLLHAVDSLQARPFYLSYFQPLVGGVERGYRYLVDSSYDWGQGLPDLERWLERKRQRGDAAPVFLTYFGADSPRARKLDVIRFGDEITDFGARNFPAQVRGGWFVISATHFQRVYLPVRGPWTRRHEELYQEVMRRLRAAQAQSARGESPEITQLRQDATDYEALQFGRLVHHLQERKPDEVIAGSLLIFRLSDADVAQALYAPLTDLPPGPGGR